VFVRSTLAERRPIDQPEVIRAMLVSRAISDFSYCTYLSDLAVDQAHQRRGIGRELIRRTHEAAGVHTHLVLVAAPQARAYYPHIGMEHHDSCWVIPRRP
jgi:predicted N-acetyltransferase YhbS